MERNTDVIGTQEFNDVWERVTGGDAAEASDVAGKAARTESPARSLKDSGLISAVLPEAATKAPSAIAPAVTRAPSRVLAPTPAVPVLCAPSFCDAAVSPEVSPEELSRLLSIMECIARSQRECCSLASKCRGQIRKTCRAIENSCRCSNQELNTQYYMLTGESCCPGSSVAPVSNVSDALRSVCNTEAAVREACVQAAEDTDIPSLETAYLRCAQCASKREKAAENLLGNLLCSGSL